MARRPQQWEHGLRRASGYGGRRLNGACHAAGAAASWSAVGAKALVPATMAPHVSPSIALYWLRWRVTTPRDVYC